MDKPMGLCLGGEDIYGPTFVLRFWWAYIREETYSQSFLVCKSVTLQNQFKVHVKTTTI